MDWYVNYRCTLTLGRVQRWDCIPLLTRTVKTPGFVGADLLTRLHIISAFVNIWGLIYYNNNNYNNDDEMITTTTTTIIKIRRIRRRRIIITINIFIILRTGPRTVTGGMPNWIGIVRLELPILSDRYPSRKSEQIVAADLNTRLK